MVENGKTGCAVSGQRILLIMSILLMVMSLSMFTGCGGSSSSDDTESDLPTDSPTADFQVPDSSTSDESTESSLSTFDVSVLEDDYDSDDYSWSSATAIILADTGITIPAGITGASESGSVLTISSAGTYSISGKLTDGRIIVETDDEEAVRLVFNGVDVTCTDSAPFYVANAARTAIILADDSDNVLTDGYTTSWVFDDTESEEPNAALHSKDYLTIGVPDGGSGNGTLTVNASYNDGITSKDGLIINGGTITVSAPDDGIRGKDYLVVNGGTLNVTTTDTGDGLLSDNDEDTERGYILIEGGNFTIDAQGDAIQAETYVLIADGMFDLTSGGGYTASMALDDDSKKGIKGVAGVMIEGGDFTINGADDAVHSNDFVIVDNGVFDIATGDDGVHADLIMEIYGGDFSITDSYEGLESSVITINEGDFYIVSDDDGLNAAGGNDGSGFDGPGGSFTPATDGEYYLYINGGYLAVYAQGDGLDSNGSIEMTGGTVLVHGPTGWDNGSLDSGDQGGEILIDGGFLIASGSSGMVESPDASSAQNFKTLVFSSSKSAGTLFHIESSDGTDVVTFAPSKEYQSIVFSSSDLETGTTYDVYFGGNSTGTQTDGLYDGGEYSGGTEDSSLSFSL